MEQWCKYFQIEWEKVEDVHIRLMERLREEEINYEAYNVPMTIKEMNKRRRLLKFWILKSTCVTSTYMFKQCCMYEKFLNKLRNSLNALKE